MADDGNVPMRTILYYPTIDIPNPGWIRQAYLYWDQISSIVPGTYGGELPEHTVLSKDLLELHSLGGYRCYSPTDWYQGDSERLQEFEDELLEQLTSPWYKPKRDANEIKNTYLIHKDKVTDYTSKMLHEIGAIIDITDEWLCFDKPAGYLYMALLAKYAADVEAGFTVPATDNPKYEQMSFRGVSLRKTPVVQLILENLIPRPRFNVSLTDIATFKRKRYDHLLRLRTVIDRFESELRKAESVDEVQHIVVRQRSELESSVADLRAVLDDAKLPSVLTTATTLLGTSLVGSGWALLHHPKTLASGALSIIGGGVAVIQQFIGLRNTRREKLRSNTYSYVYLGEQARIIRPHSMRPMDSNYERQLRAKVQASIQRNSIDR